MSDDNPTKPAAEPQAGACWPAEALRRARVELERAHALYEHVRQQAAEHLQDVPRKNRRLGTVGKEQTCGTLYGRIRSGPATYLRVSTDDASGRIRAYLGEGRFTDDPMHTFGAYGVIEIHASRHFSNTCAGTASSTTS